MRRLIDRAKGSTLRRRWAADEALAALDLEVSAREQALLLDAPIADVQKVLAAALKPGRKQVSAVRFAGGKIQEVTDSTIGLITAEAEQELDRRREEPKPTVAATVAVPVQGCPEPDFEPADVRATRVLKAFLTPQQIEDFDHHQAFISTGADSGLRYQITSRHARTELRHARRTLFSLDEQMPFCVHDWDVPAAEEMLAIHLLLQMPGHESYLRYLHE